MKLQDDKEKQEEQLKKLKEKQLPAGVKKSVEEKLKYVNKPINK